ncbi:MAG: undecaprenyldiphospho-muramoylpentapeptide beta-N-acetylglucosaminyltransferase [Bacteroidota bacterium]|nr:undecaprenyldiphospho-muramoylpentapeptide beta-N-acetylglucosaminyltransferase [Bacteroidota bacterium]MDP4273645.1 undecaprenyldiphospho-muramoylpentapeptide beta-N-acetylglucosaminyltransferase [Bacteroidota bacterium]
MEKTLKKIIISGGGTGGHIFPAVSIANELKARDASIDILFVGAENRMEMEKVPAAGYKIVGLPVSGFQRKNLLKNFSVLLRLWKSMAKAKKVLKEFHPDVAVGVGGYASGPLLKQAQRLNIPTLIQEQNSYAGVTNRLLAKKVARICVAYPGMEKYFPADKIILTGNPVRQDVVVIEGKKEEALAYFGLQPGKPTLLIIGGSLGARSINESVLASIDLLVNSDVQVIWQTGKIYYKRIMATLKTIDHPNIKVSDFVTRMDLAYSLADLVISRSGAISVSELCLCAKPAILVPSPNVAEDHQTKNATALVDKQAAVLVKDVDAKEMLIPKAFEILKNKELRAGLSKNISKLALRDSASAIVDEIFKLIK